MSGLELVIFIPLVCWLATLTVGTLLCIHQLTIVTKRLDLVAGPPAPGDSGLAIGMPIPPAVVELLAPETPEGALLLLMSATCGPCRVVAEELRQNDLGLPTVVLLPGRPDAASEIAALLPATVEVVRDPQATELSNALQITLTPFALAVKEGWVVGKSYVNHLEDMRRLADAMAEVDIDERELIYGGNR